MISDRYIPDADADGYDADDHDSAQPPARSSRDGSHAGKQHKKHAAHKSKHGEKSRREASVEDVEDGEIVEADAAGGEAAEAAAEAVAAGRRSGEGGVTTADARAADKHRYPAGEANSDKLAKGRPASPLASPDGSSQQRASSKPPSGKRDRSREGSRERSRDRSHRDRDREKHRRDRSKERGGRDRSTRDRSRDRSARDRSRDRSRDRRSAKDSGPPPSRRPSSSHDAEAAALPPPPQQQPQGRDRSSSRPRADGSRRAAADDSRRGSRHMSSDSGARGAGEQRDRERRPEPLGYLARQRERERERDADGRDDARDSRKRRNRSRSRSRSRGRHDREDGGRYRKRSRDEGRSRRHSSDDDAELDLDPNVLLEGDALGLSNAEREAQEEARRLEESRKRRQAILAKHQQAAAVAAPTATAAAAAAAADGGGGVSEAPGAAAAQNGNAQQLPTEAADEQQQQAQKTAAPQQEHGAGADAANGDGDASPPAATAAAAMDGAATPEGDRSSSDDSHNAPGTPVMDIWNSGLPSQQGAAGVDEVSSRPAGATEAEELTSQLPVHLVMPGTEPNMQSERLRVAMPNAAAGGGVNAGAAAAAAAAAAGAAAAEKGGDDMFADDDDMFAEGGGEGGGGVQRNPVIPVGLMDNYDDPEGYYNFQVGEMLDGRYEVFACKGKGVFSTVLRARDKLRLLPNPLTGAEEFAEVAIKVIRSNETMSKAAALEQRILRMLSDKDPDNRKHIIRLLRTFEYRHHVCMVFEPMDMNLRELTLKYGRNVGLNITAVGVYAAQLLVALRHLQQCSVLHADIKPDNILVNARRSKVKICDLGSAMLAGENERTPYLISRFYRSPEVILGLAYGFPMDMWSVGCVLYELFTGKILFPGHTNNQMLKLMMDVKGPFPKKMLKKGIFVEKHFEPDAQLSFSLVEEDPVTKQPVRRVITNPTVKHNFSQLLARAEGDKKQVADLADLLEKMLALDPEKRITADAALRHDFVKPYLPKKKAGAKH